MGCVIGTNLVGAFLSSKAVASKLIEQESGRIISISSGRAFQGAKNAAHYAFSKAGIIGFSKALALELAPHRITVNVICPGKPLGRIGQPEDLVWHRCFFGKRGRRLHHRANDHRKWRQHHVVSQVGDKLKQWQTRLL
jgi:NAD(P)-dependent dehydrogenase (short-subunit alcohol dehydrogenase family)